MHETTAGAGQPGGEEQAERGDVTGGVNIAMKIPAAEYSATVAFYRDVLGLPVTEVPDSGAATVSASCSVTFGPCTLWLDRVDNYSRSDVWLELRTTDLPATLARLRRAGTTPCDEVEPLDEPGSRWVRNPAGVVHLLRQETAGP